MFSICAVYVIASRWFVQYSGVYREQHAKTDISGFINLLYDNECYLPTYLKPKPKPTNQPTN
jgi:hypothetical protein